jgi:hypothetical protein
MDLVVMAGVLILIKLASCLNSFSSTRSFRLYSSSLLLLWYDR